MRFFHAYFLVGSKTFLICLFSSGKEVEEHNKILSLKIFFFDLLIYLKESDWVIPCPLVHSPDSCRGQNLAGQRQEPGTQPGPPQGGRCPGSKPGPGAPLGGGWAGLRLRHSEAPSRTRCLGLLSSIFLNVYIKFVTQCLGKNGKVLIIAQEKNGLFDGVRCDFTAVAW